MGYVIFLVFISLATSLVLSLVRRNPAARWARLFRIGAVVLSSAVFAYLFVQRSTTRFVKDSLAVQLVNRLPQPVDFYIINKESPKDAKSYTVTRHLGTIRPEYYRIEYMKMLHSDEFWVAGFLGKKNLVYFSQHAVPNKNMDQIVEVSNYIVQSQRLADAAKSEISAYQHRNQSLSVWITLSLLLLFMNLALLLRKH